ncbi:hypothetical protein BDY21DRAFT_355625 [Lineolata rhizophorae]|uniref:DUF1264-domain-containing protein n=1 Tax=Lineolata rhizophorae TaxID=578093 RepID=A0A6A6NQE1_9PEZI|nr:hypothetical protein BDY21DRAFT_355625 [Lineolata rhizophorae]
MESRPVTSGAAGGPLSTKSRILEAGANMVQDFRPVNQICAHLNAYHAYADEPGRCVEANHYCSHLNEDIRQCILYDSPEKGARLIGVEYMITHRLFETLPEEERHLWHSHVFEVKSGMLIMPRPSTVPDAVWETAETKEMEDVVVLYGKAYHLWQVDRGDKIPLGEPKLVTSFTQSRQMEPCGGFEKLVGERDSRFGESWKRKQEIRSGIKEPEISTSVDRAWDQVRRT